MHCELSEPKIKAFWVGVKDTIPFTGGIASVALSFGIIAIESGFELWEAVVISSLMNAGASQFMFVAMVASGAPITLIIISTLLINGRHIVYGPTLAPHISKNSWWLILMHGLTDQLFALAHNRFPTLAFEQRFAWFFGAALTSWICWILGTAFGAAMGSNLITQFPILAEALPFALPALFIVLLAPQLNSLIWFITLVGAMSIALVLKLVGYANVAILLGAIFGTALYYAVDNTKRNTGSADE